MILQELKAKLNPFMQFLLKANEPWLVGGAIRDAIIGLPIKDFDFAIKESGIEFAKWFATKIKGKFVLLDEKNDEARVVYRKELEVAPLTFDFNGMESIEKDLSRRDFTINAIAARLPGLEIFDPFYGVKDVEKGRIKMVSENGIRDDPLRILRGFRFSATLGFKITAETIKVMKQNVRLLNKSAAERKREEIMLLLKVKNSYPTLQRMARLGILDVIIPELKPMRKVAQGKRGGNLLNHSILTVKKIEQMQIKECKEYFNRKLATLKLSALLHDIGKPYCYSEDKRGQVHFYGHERKGIELLNNVREKLRLSNYEFRSIATLIRYHMRPHLLASDGIPTAKAIWRLVRDGGADTPGIFLLAYADAIASGGMGSKKLLDLLKIGITMWKDMRRPKFKRIITGDDLIALGLKPGPRFRKILQEVEEAQVSGELRTKEEAIEFVRQKYCKKRQVSEI
ncbi:MAG: HD domain-containing protein [bacterium]|nr:HD domain-containing protein [bacterium]